MHGKSIKIPKRLQHKRLKSKIYNEKNGFYNILESLNLNTVSKYMSLFKEKVLAFTKPPQRLVTLIYFFKSTYNF